MRRRKSAPPDNRPTTCPYCGKENTKYHTERHIPRCAKNPAALTACPYCGKGGTQAAVAHHASGCLSNPQVLAALRDALQSDVEGEAVSPSEYRELARGTDLPALTSIERSPGGWDGLLAKLGLRRGRRRSRQGSRRAQEERFEQLDRDMEAYIQWCRQVERAERYGAPPEDGSEVKVLPGGRRVRVFANGAQWELPEPPAVAPERNKDNDQWI